MLISVACSLRQHALCSETGRDGVCDCECHIVDKLVAVKEDWERSLLDDRFEKEKWDAKARREI